MYKNANNQIQYSATDLVNFAGCSHKTYLDLLNLEQNIKKSKADPMNVLLQKKGDKHEKDYLEILRAEGKSIVEIPKALKLDERVQKTIDAMNSGPDVIYQAVFCEGNFRGDADFIIKVNIPSALGKYSYEVMDTKLAVNPKASQVIQLCFYSELLANVQKYLPQHTHLVLGDQSKESYQVKDFIFYYQAVKQKFQKFVDQKPDVSYPEPCQACEHCDWSDNCQEQWQKDDHLSLVANIQKTQLEKIKKSGIETLTQLAKASPEHKVLGLNQNLFQKLNSQAKLQLHKKVTGENKFELLTVIEGKGFSRLPQPDEGDLFFDMEGDPLHPNGLEYLFGVYYLENKKHVFKPFWGHDHDQEKVAFTDFMKFVEERLQKYPNAYIYHYNHYETTALKRLACRYGIAEEQMDVLLRTHKFVDLYKVVREGLQTSEPKYSLKNLEVFYMAKRDGEVATAGESIVVYNQWRDLKDANLLKQIEDYNQVDCESTYLCREWLLKIKPSSSPWFKCDDSEELNSAKPERKEWEIEYEQHREKLGEQSSLTYLLEFHNREAKPQWWAVFERQDKFEDELIDDVECIGGLTLVGKPVPEKRSFLYSYQFPPQDYKLKADDKVRNTETAENIGTIFDLNEEQYSLTIKSTQQLPQLFSVGPSGPIDHKRMRDAIYRVAKNIIVGSKIYSAVFQILGKEIPRFINKKLGDLIIKSDDLLAESIEAVKNLDQSYLVIQGPPGSGKTFASAHMIVELMKSGKKVGIAANSHKVIHHVLDKVAEVARKQNFTFKGIKRSSTGSETEYQNEFIISQDKTEKNMLTVNLLAGTAWLFSDELLNNHLDFLFIDEAGQVALANVVAMGTSTKNIILIGDQMQLGQPTQGVHPGESGLSVLDYLLKGHAVIPPDRGIFLKNTYRLDPKICQFISDAFYDGQLKAKEDNVKRKLFFEKSMMSLPSSGIHFISIESKDCSQKNESEGQVLAEIYAKLLKQQFQDKKDNKPRQITMNDILVVSPYNVQVNYLKSILPNGARVGTVDKFQGQEAAIVLFSMVSSSAEDLPRNIEFLFSKNRLNVAISRAQCLAVVFASPKLLDIPCKSIEQMKLVNTFCRLIDFSGHKK